MIIKGHIFGLCLTIHRVNHKTVSFLVFNLAYMQNYIYRLSATPAATFLQTPTFDQLFRRLSLIKLN